MPPFEKYQFSYAGSVPDAIAQGLLEMRTTRQDSVLPLLQVICTQLYEQVPHPPRGRSGDHPGRLRRDRWCAGGMRKHAETLVSTLFRGERRPTPDRFRALMASLTLQQPDGSLSTALLPADELRSRGQVPGRRSTICSKGPPARRSGCSGVATLSFGGQGPRPYVSLGHDALAKVAASGKQSWSREDFDRKRRSQVRKMAAGLAAATARHGRHDRPGGRRCPVRQSCPGSEAAAHQQEKIAIENKMRADNAAAEALPARALPSRMPRCSPARPSPSRMPRGQEERGARRDPPQGGRS